jgi:hypothetical protein
MRGTFRNGIAPGITASKQKGTTLKEISSSSRYVQYV